MIHVFIVDDHKILAQALFDFLNTAPNIECIGMEHSAEKAIEEITRIKPDVVLMDIVMPGMNGVECCRKLMKIDDQLNIIGLSTHMEISVVKSLFKAGAKGYVSKAADLREIPVAIERVNEGQRYIGEVIREEFMAEMGADSAGRKTPKGYIPNLTQREKEVLELIAQECTTEEIGKRLFISVNTVQTHRKNLISKFGVRNSVGLVLKALELRLIE